MPPLTPQASTEADRDQRLAEILSTLTEEVRRGQEVDIAIVAAQHPDLADELRELWAAVLFAQEFSRQRQLPETAPAALPSVDGPLPRTFGDYELLEVLGRGGMGVVYKAWQKSLRRTVALKMLLHGDNASDSDQARFRAEAQAVANLIHPQIVAVYDAGECDGRSYFSMRHVEGQTLAALLANGPLRGPDAVRYLAPVARAVDFAHKHGILHRDLKPANVLLDRAGQPHVTDFGLAKRVSRSATETSETGLTLTGAVLGTPAYMAPEQVTGSRGTPSPASDVYSLGVILYEMLTGRPPFQGATAVDTLLLVLDQDPVRPRMLNPNVDPDLELICLKCLQKDPVLRYTSAAELADDLEAFQRGEKLSVRSSGLRDIGALFTRMLRDTPHAIVLENWGLLWMCHSLMILLQCVVTTWMAWEGLSRPIWYLGLWGGGLVIWGAIFWSLRKRGGPVLFVERQVAHVWASSVIATVGIFILEMLLGFHVLALAPMLAIIAGMTFVIKAGMLSGEFYLSALALFLTAIPMAMFPRVGILLFGLVSASCFFVPGLKYHRQRLRSLRAGNERSLSS